VKSLSSNEGRPESLHFGQLLVARKIINRTQLETALEEQKRYPYLRIGEILLGMGMISFAQLRENLEDQYKDIRIGQLLSRLGIVNMAQLEEALQIQEHSGERIGQILVRLGYCTEVQLYRTLSLQR
jgi:hypothetical protein